MVERFVFVREWSMRRRPGLDPEATGNESGLCVRAAGAWRGAAVAPWLGTGVLVAAVRHRPREFRVVCPLEWSRMQMECLPFRCVSH